MSKNRSKRNTKEALKKLKAKRARVKYSTGGYQSGQSLGYTPSTGNTSVKQIPLFIPREDFGDFDVEDDPFDQSDYIDVGYDPTSSSGMGVGTYGFNTNIPAPTGVDINGGSGQGGSSTGGQGGRNRTPTEEKTEEEKKKEQEERDAANEAFGFPTSSDRSSEDDADEADATGDGTLEGGDDGGGTSTEEPPPPVVEPIDEEPTTGGTDLTGTDLDVDIAEPKTKFVNEDGSTFNPEDAPKAKNPFDKKYTSRGGATYSKDDLMRLTGGDKDKLQELEDSGFFNTVDGESWKAPVDSTDVYNDDGTLNLSNMDADLGLDGQDGPDLGGDLSAGDDIVNAGDEGLTWQGRVWDAAKGTVVKTLTGAAIGAAVGDYYGLSKSMVAKLLGKEAFKAAVIDEATGAIIDIGTGLPVVGAPLQAILDFKKGITDIPANIFNTAVDTFTGGSDTTFVDTSATTTTFGYDPTGGISVGTGAGTVSESGGTATSGTTTATGITETTNPIDVPENEGDRGTASDEDEVADTTSETPTTYDNSDLGTLLSNLDLDGRNGDKGMAIERDENGVPIDVTSGTGTAGGQTTQEPVAPPTDTDVVMTDKTLTTQQGDIEQLAPMEQATAPTVSAETLAPVAAAAPTTVDQAAPVQAQTVQTVTADQVKKQKAAEAFNQTPEVTQFKADSEAHIANPERVALMEARKAAAESGDTGAQAQAEAALKAFDADMNARGEALGRKQQEFISTYGDPVAVKGEITEGSTAVATDATLTERAGVAERDTAAEQAALAQEVGFDVSTKSMVDPVTGEKIQVAATPAAEAAQREAITDDTFTPMEAAQITETLGYEAVQNRPVKGEAAQGAAVEMLAEVGDMPPAIAEAIVEDPAKVEAQLDNEPVEVRAAIAALPKEALMSSQMENLLGSLEENKVPVWARPAVDATNAMLAKRGLSSSTIGRDSLFNAIIQSALPIAENNANALQKRAAQNLDNQQQANITTATLDMERRMNNLANQQTAASQTAQLSNDMKKLQSTFKQEAVLTTAQQEQQVRLQNLENRQRTAEQNNRNQQETMALNLGNQQQMELVNLEIEAQVNSENMSAENQRRLAEMNVAAEFLSKNAELKNSMDIANMSTEAQMKLANLQALNQASSDNLTAQQQTELANMEADLKTKLTQADIASSMGVAQLNADQQRAVVNAQTVANIDLAKFDAKQQAELVNSKFAQTMTLENFNAENTAILQNATSQASMDLTNADNRTKVSVTNAQNFLQMDLANLANEQQASILKSQQEQQILLSDTAAANATAQFNAESIAQTDQFMATLGAQIDQYNATAVDSMSKFNIEQQNKVNAENAGNQLKADMANASLASETEQFNLNMANQRDQWNASNRQTIQQSDLTWRRNANTADTAAINDANRQNVQNAFNMSLQQQNQLWLELRDEATFANNNYENTQQRIVQLTTAAMAADTAYAAAGTAPAQSLAATLSSIGLIDTE